jgi:septal ring factor EnvC (AmiA/AmiB activator)
MRLLVTLILFVSCSSPLRKEQIEKPKDYSEIIQEIEKAPEIKQEKKDKIINTIKEQSQYSKNVYDRLLELEQKMKSMEEEIETLKKDKIQLEKEKKELEMELATWNTIKIWFWSIVIIVFLGLAFKMLSPIIIPIIKKLAGVPI